MRKSFIEYIKSLGRWGWLVLVDIILGGAGAYFDISGKLSFPTWVWILLLGIAFVIIPFIAFHKLQLRQDELQSELDSIKNERPKIETTIRTQQSNFDIEVLNNGENAEFEAQIQVLEGQNFVLSLPLNYIAYWENTKNDKTQLRKGERDWLKIATLQIQTTPYPIANLQLHYYQVASFRCSSSPMITEANSTSWFLGNHQVVRPCIMLKVIISSNPSMIGGALIRIYKLSDNGLSEVN
jgi:hypothetical protein